MAPPRVALFVEGSTEEKLRGGRSALKELWASLAAAVGGAPLSAIHGINKKHLLALDPEYPPKSSQAEPLDYLMERVRSQNRFDAAIVAWDLVPRWNKEMEQCRRAEVLDLYRLLALSEVLPPEFAAAAAARHRALQAGEPSLPYLGKGSIVGLCMDPDFEVVFADLEKAIFVSTGLKSRPKDWPNFKNARRYDRVLETCVDALPRAAIPRHLPRTLESGKNTWAAHFLEHCLGDPAARERLLQSPPLARFNAILRSSLSEAR